MMKKRKMLEIIKKFLGIGRKDNSSVETGKGNEEVMKKFLILCLGNIGPDYEMTRHNSGFLIGDELVREEGGEFHSCKYGDMAKIRVKNCELLVMKPSTFMNLSGVAARYWLNKEKLPLENFLVIVDDVALPFGTIRLRERGSDAGHNGLKNIAEQLGTQNYARLKFGIGNNYSKGGQIDYVLGRFEKEEQESLPELTKRASTAIKAFCLSGASYAMTHFNG